MGQPFLPLGFYIRPSRPPFFYLVSFFPLLWFISCPPRPTFSFHQVFCWVSKHPPPPAPGPSTLLLCSWPGWDFSFWLSWVRFRFSKIHVFLLLKLHFCFSAGLFKYLPKNWGVGSQFSEPCLFPKIFILHSTRDDSLSVTLQLRSHFLQHAEGSHYCLQPPVSPMGCPFNFHYHFLSCIGDFFNWKSFQCSFYLWCSKKIRLCE